MPTSAFPRLVLSLALIAIPGTAKKDPTPPIVPTIPFWSRLYVAPMMGQLDGFLAAEIVKKRLPLKIVTEEAQADYILVGISLPEDNRWYNFAFGGKDKNEANVRLLNPKDKSLVWAGEAGDRSLWLAGLRRGGERKLADRIVQAMERDLFRGRHL